MNVGNQASKRFTVDSSVCELKLVIEDTRPNISASSSIVLRYLGVLWAFLRTAACIASEQISSNWRFWRSAPYIDQTSPNIDVSAAVILGISRPCVASLI